MSWLAGCMAAAGEGRWWTPRYVVKVVVAVVVCVCVFGGKREEKRAKAEVRSDRRGQGEAGSQRREDGGGGSGWG